MNPQRFEKAGKWLFGITLVGGIVFSTNGFEFLPVITGIVFLTALAGFPGFRQQMRWRRMFLFSIAAMLIPLGMYYLATLDNLGDPVADFYFWAVWPLADEDTISGISLTYLLPFWALMNGLLFGFIIESFSALSKQQCIKRIEACVRRDSEEEGDVPPFGLAGILCLACMAVICLTAWSLAGLSLRLYEWLVPGLFVIGPMATTFITLYRSSWRLELPATRRVVAIMLRSSVIFGVVLFIVLLICMAMMFLPAHEVSRGQYGAL